MTRTESIKQLNYFCENLLVDFGSFQDAMHQEETNLNLLNPFPGYSNYPKGTKCTSRMPEGNCGMLVGSVCDSRRRSIP